MNNLTKKILIVDDEKDICNLLSRYLSIKLHTASITHTATSYSMGSDMLEKVQYDLCIFDYNLGDGTGLELLKKTKARHPNCATMMMSADVSDEQIEEFYQNGAYTFIKKPLKLKQIDDLVYQIAKLTDNDNYEEPN